MELTLASWVSLNALIMRIYQQTTGSHRCIHAILRQVEDRICETICFDDLVNLTNLANLTRLRKLPFFVCHDDNDARVYHQELY